MTDNVVPLPVVRVDREEPREFVLEVWHFDRKVTVYSDTVLRIWGDSMDDEMSDEPRTMESVQAAFDWLYKAERRGPDL